ncbi:hypothetical protein PHLGIDRAFT_460187 [Phlebiopsis gigantea 11061_1 CR5-6]|uniref:Mediator of RNA polymerase II transcription subunit 14 n=1 Tax=Phlebiopsis gigantea (strain 11061_1 CR5-6) TaxID=745531 RepID=A0A0C3RX99_PHLG1|nr:hypothetical protein PHLGIDRAFT_460187 [Phlebiopsis gigantea 11061_1 CR5-6]
MDHTLSNGVKALDIVPSGLEDSPTLEQLERELRTVYDGQIPLGELVSRMAQAIYAELTEHAETMPHMSDIQRKRTLAEWVVKTKKQVVKLYAVAKWSRDAAVVQKALESTSTRLWYCRLTVQQNLVAFLMEQNRQFDEAISLLHHAKDTLDGARARNHDLLTSLDVLTTGSYHRLPSVIKKAVVQPDPLTPEDIRRTVADIEDVMRYRLRMHELVPREMSRYHITDGRVYFVAPNLFETSVCLKGAKSDDGWFFSDVEFLFQVGGDVTGMQDFPRRPNHVLMRPIADEADLRLGYYLQPEPVVPEGTDLPKPPSPPRLPDGVVDAPLVRLFNFLQMMSLSYQLEILWFQAERMRNLGWAEYLKVEMSKDRKTLTLTYWLRKPPPSNLSRNNAASRIPLFGGTLTISIIPTQPAPPLPPAPSTSSIRPSQSQNFSSQTSISSLRPSQSQSVPSSQTQRREPELSRYRQPPKTRVLAELQERAKLNIASKEQDRRLGKPSDEPEGMVLHVDWQPQHAALGIKLQPGEALISPDELMINSNNLDVEALLRKIIWTHSRSILHSFYAELSAGQWSAVFGRPGEVVLDIDESASLASLRVNLCADEVVFVTLDPRTGRLAMRDSGDLAATGRALRHPQLAEAVNANPTMLPDLLMRMRNFTILDTVEQKANYLGLQIFRQRNFRPEDLQKFGHQMGLLYVQLANFPTHYLVLVITDQDFRYALVSANVLPEAMYPELIMEDIGWLDVRRIHGDEVIITPDAVLSGQVPHRVMDSAGPSKGMTRFRLETQVLRELYAYCCARVAYTKVERQLKNRSIPYIHVIPSLGAGTVPALTHIHSSLARAIPALCVQSSDILSGAPAAEAAMPNIRVIPLNWWADQKIQVITCVKLKYVQQPVGKRAGSGAVIRPSKRIIYDTREAIVTFLSEDVDKCVDEFLEEWARVSKMVVIAREIAQMSSKRKWTDVRLLSFDLQTVEFAYAQDYTVSITCTDQLSPTGGTYDLHFSRMTKDAGDVDEETADIDTVLAQYNPHEDVEPFMQSLLRSGPLSASLVRLVSMLRDTLPIVTELEYIRVSAARAGENVDTFAKTAGWFRVLYGDFRHALDFRLMSQARVAILDASNTLYPHDKTSPHSREDDLVLQPIPDFRAIVVDACKDVLSTMPRTKTAPIDIGVVCEPFAVRAVARALHERVSRKLKETKVKTEPV